MEAAVEGETEALRLELERLRAVLREAHICKRCGLPIVWAVNPAGKAIAVSAKAKNRADLVLVTAPGAPGLLAKPANGEDVARYWGHTRVCPKRRKATTGVANG